MVIYEAGLLFRDQSILKSVYIQKSAVEIYQIIRNELVLSLLNLVEEAFITDFIDYLGGKNYIIAFIEEKIIAKDTNKPELLIAYCIVNNKKKIDKYIKKVAVPLLRKTIERFKMQFKLVNISDLSQLSSFKKDLDDILGDETKTIDQKLRDQLF